MVSIEFENAICIALHNGMQMPMKKLLANSPEMKNTLDVEFESFLYKVRSKMGKIHSYSSSDNHSKDLIIAAHTGNFMFAYTIKPDLVSVCKIEMLTKVSREFNSSFLKTKLPVGRGYVYFLKSKFGYKIGCTSKLERRMNEFGVKLPFDVSLHSYIISRAYNRIESELHILFKEKRIDGEWFDINDDDFLDLDKYLSNQHRQRIIYDGNIIQASEFKNIKQIV